MKRAERRGGRARGRARSLVALTWVVAVALPPGEAGAQAPFRVTPTLSGELTWSNNIGLRPAGERESDFNLAITPGLVFDYRAPRATLTGSITAPILLYAKNEEDNRVLPVVDLKGNVELVKEFFFVDAQATVTQTYLNPFGPRPADLGTLTDNRYTASIYSVAPYIRGEFGNLRYRLRDENIWSFVNDSAIRSQSVYTNALTGSIDRDPTPIGWGFDISRTETDFPDTPQPNLQEHARFRVVYRPDPVWQVFASGGYERNRFPLSENDGTTYGLGVAWRPTERTQLDAGWEHRFFGESYYFNFGHRGPRTAWGFRASRNITSYPEQLARLESGSFVPLILDQILASRIADPNERLRFIIDYMRDRGLPLFLSDPLTLYAQQVYLQELASASFGIIGVRNTVFFSVYRSKTEPLPETGLVLPPPIVNVGDNTQLGGGVVWTYALTPTATLTLSGDASRTDANAPFTGRTDQWSVRIGVTRPISPRTSAHAGARYQALDSSLQPGYREAAVFIGASHTFR